MSETKQKSIHRMIKRDMKLRDRIATEALAALIQSAHANPLIAANFQSTCCGLGISTESFMSKSAYTYADAMMEARGE